LIDIDTFQHENLSSVMLCGQRYFYDGLGFSNILLMAVLVTPNWSLQYERVYEFMHSAVLLETSTFVILRLDEYDSKGHIT
jgi:hypothetical protein